MKKFLLPSLLAATCMLMPLTASAQREAFPGAEGYGRMTTGGRGGRVFHVTTLDDTGEQGSFRYAIEQSGTRTIVFDVSGTIHLNSELKLSNGNITIAGQTAPGDGICIADYPFSISADNVIIRFMRFRLGNKNVTLDGADGWDGLGAIDRKDIIVDHCSVSWSIDECLSFVGCENTTVQWCIVSQSMVNSGHSKGAHGYGGNWGGAKASYHHNLLAHHTSRVPRLGPRYTTQLREHMDMRNNVMYNYSGESCYGGEAMNINIVNNYYKPGPGNKYISATGSTAPKASRIAAIGIRTNSYISTYPAYEPTLHKVGTYYVNGNQNSERPAVLQDNWENGIYNQIDWSDWDDVANTTEKRNQVKQDMRLDTPIDYVYTTTHTPDDAYTKVLAYAGASLSRDELDKMIVEEATNNSASSTGSGLDKGFINTQNDVKLPSGNIWPELKSTAAPIDTDGDGIPDTWERENGLDPEDATDGSKITNDGYTNLEHYINSLVDEIMTAENEGGKLLTGNLEMSDDAVELPPYDPTTDPGLQEPESIFLTYSDANSSKSASPYTDLYTGTVTTKNNEGLEWPDYNIKMYLIKDDKAYSGGNTNTYGKPIKLSNGAPNLIVLPEGFTTNKIEFYGYCNSGGSTSWISDISVENNGILESVYSNTTGDTNYINDVTKEDWSAMEEDNMPVITCDLSKSVSGNIWFKNGGKQPAFYIKIYKEDGQSGIDDIISDREKAAAGNGKTYNLMGIEVNEPLAPGIYIRDGKKFLVK